MSLCSNLYLIQTTIPTLIAQFLLEACITRDLTIPGLISGNDSNTTQLSVIQKVKLQAAILITAIRTLGCSRDGRPRGVEWFGLGEALDIVSKIILFLTLLCHSAISRVSSVLIKSKIKRIQSGFNHVFDCENHT
jgi:hypothetical protein